MSLRNLDTANGKNPKFLSHIIVVIYITENTRKKKKIQPEVNICQLTNEHILKQSIPRLYFFKQND